MAGEISEETGEMLKERLISAEHKIWCKNAPYFYDLITCSALDWPSLTCQWLPGQIKVSNQAVRHELLLGTHTTGDQNYLLVAVCTLPTENAVIEMSQYDDVTREVGGFGFVSSSVENLEIKLKIKHEGEVNRARYMPQNHNIIATRGPSTDLFIWDLRRHASFAIERKEAPSCSPQGLCQGHCKEGYAMDWSPLKEGMLISGADDTSVKLWDIKEAYSKDYSRCAKIEALSTFHAHDDTVEDVAWHIQDPNLFGSVGDDQRLCLWDVRNHSTTVRTVEKAHASDINCLAFHPTEEYVLATGGADAVIAIWDIRNMLKPMNKLHGHTDQIFKVEWSPTNSAILGSCSADRRVALWDLSRVGEHQSSAEAEDGPPELLFLHGGHTSKVSDFSWNPNSDYEWTIASVSDDNILHIWQPAEDVYTNRDDKKNDLQG